MIESVKFYKTMTCF